MDGPGHIPVLLEEVLTLLAPRPGDVALDCTAGLGGHASAIASKIGPTGVLVLNDLDPANLSRAAERVRLNDGSPRVVELRGNFADAARRVHEAGLRCDVVLADLGFSSSQMDDSARGMSFQREGPLDMRMDPSGPVTASDLVNSLSERELSEVLRDFGEEREHRRIARKIVDARRAGPISTTSRLAELARSALRGRGGSDRIDPATRTFQALRIAVNDEMGNLAAFLDSVTRGAEHSVGESGWLAPGARIGVISFHSLEDRPVKQAFGAIVERELSESLARKPVTPTEEEIAANPRSRSAKLRAVRLVDKQAG